jgi:hypothetical protein
VSQNFEPGQRCRVTSAYQAAYPDPLVIKVGERLQIGDRATDWPGWLWCINELGKSGWAPASYVDRRERIGLARRDYDATELSAQVGEELVVGYAESGWLWCTNRAGQSGWIPADNVE